MLYLTTNYGGIDMHKVKEIVYNEIHEIETNGLTSKNLSMLGDLVDIYKDVCNIEYWNEKLRLMKNDTERSKIHHELAKVNEIYDKKQKGILVDDETLEQYILDLIIFADEIKASISRFKLDGKAKTMYDSLYK